MRNGGPYGWHGGALGVVPQLHEQGTTTMSTAQPAFSNPGAHGLDAGGTISQALDVYKNNLGVLVPLAFGVFAIQGILAFLLAGSFIGAIITVVTGTVLGLFFQGAVVELARDVEDGTLDSSIGDLLSAVSPVIFPLFLVGILNGIAVAVGLIAFIIPGLFLLTIFAVVGPVTVLERPGVFAAFGRSRALVSGAGWAVFGLILFNFVVGTLVGTLASALVGGGVVGAILTWVISAFLVPLTALVIAIAYLRLRDAHGEPPLATGTATPAGPAPAGPSPFS